jgi:cytochrome c peroxidase
MAKRCQWRALTLLWGLCSFSALAQLPPPLQVLPQVPVGNPQTPSKVALGKVLFWDEQLSLTGTVACGTCHRPQSSGTDPRSLLSAAALHPGPDGVFGNADDIRASPGVPAHDAAGNYNPDPRFGLRPRVGNRKATSVVNAAYAPFLFWDGRAGSQFVDSDTQQVVLGNFAALETQALAPLLNTSEMGHEGVTLSAVVSRLQSISPLALALDVPPPLTTWLAARSYPELFAEAFGDAAITPVRVAMALASYQRTLIADQTPVDQGAAALTSAQLAGAEVFRSSDCQFCHSGPLFSDFRFHYIGVRPVNEDLGRFVQTGEAGHRGAMLTPGLRGVAQRGPYMHTGTLATLEDVVEFYNRGGDFSAPNKAGQVRPRNWTSVQKANLLAYLRALSDPRVAAELPPFDRPTLYSESERVPQQLGEGIAGAAGVVPQLSALEPPLLGNDNFTMVLSQGLAGATAYLVVDAADPGLTPLPEGSFTRLQQTLSAVGHSSFQLHLAVGALHPGQTLWARAYVEDPSANGGYAISPAVRFSVFGVQVDPIFAGGFEGSPAPGP